MNPRQQALAATVLLAAIPTLATAAGNTAESTAGNDIDKLRAELARQSSQIDAQQKQIEALADAQEAAPAGSSGATTVGMYGEVHFNALGTSDPAVGKNNIHAHRVVLLLAHRYSDELRFFSELEFEGAPDSTDVETEVEQFGIAWQAHENLQLTIGQFLVPVGLLNETHEPDAIYGVERNPVEEFIIPATWWEKGVMAGIRLNDDLHLDLAVHNGLRGDIATLGGTDGLRGFRQEFGGARAEDLAYTARLKYAAAPGLEFGAAVQRQDNITQSNDPLTGGASPATLWETHAIWQKDRYAVRALATGWAIANANAKAVGTDRLAGWYVEPSVKVTERTGLFARWNQWNTAANIAGSDDETQLNVGANFWLDPRVVLKADIQGTNRPDGAGDGFNLGLGLSF